MKKNPHMEYLIREWKREYAKQGGNPNSPTFKRLVTQLRNGTLHTPRATM